MKIASYMSASRHPDLQVISQDVFNALQAKDYVNLVNSLEDILQNGDELQKDYILYWLYQKTTTYHQQLVEIIKSQKNKYRLNEIYFLLNQFGNISQTQCQPKLGVPLMKSAQKQVQYILEYNF